MGQPEEAESDGQVVTVGGEGNQTTAGGGDDRAVAGGDGRAAVDGGERAAVDGDGRAAVGNGRTEDVLEPAGPVDDLPPVPSRSWRTRGDFVALALIVVAVLVASLVLWQTSDARNTTSQTGSSEITALPPVTVLPPTLSEAWREPSGATSSPVTLDSVVVTADGGEVVGRDALTDTVRWRYSRDWPLCSVNITWGKVIAAHRKDDNCSEITTLDLASGKRGPQRNGDAELGTRLLPEGSHVVTTGETYFEVYRRDDLVRSMEYGALRAIVNPNKQPRVGCAYGSFAVTGGKVAIIERCYAQEAADRLTVLKPNPEKSDEPQVISSVVVGAKGARVIAVTATRVAVAVPGKVAVFDSETGGLVAEYPVDVTEAELAGDPPGRVVPTMTSTANVYWFTGSRTVALSINDLVPLWTARDTIGAGTTLAGRVLVPVRGALKVLDQVTGEEVGSIPVNRGDYTGPVEMATEGPVVLEQRGGTLVALR